MHIRLRYEGKVSIVANLKKTSLVRELKNEIEKVTGLTRKEQRLLYRGKQLDIEAYNLHDYDVDNNVVIDCSKRYIIEDSAKKDEDKDKVDIQKDDIEENKENGGAGNGAVKADPEPEQEQEPEQSSSSSAATPEDEKPKETIRDDQQKVKLEDIYDGDVKELVEEPPCKGCKGDPNEDKCKECGCQGSNICLWKDREEVMLMCDECEYYYHYDCLTPPLTGIPDGDWYCPVCKNDENEVVKAGQLLKYNKKKAKAPSAKCSKKWGGGMATAGRQKSCTKVPSNHFGPIPGIDVGMCWKYRMQISEEGIHRPPVAGIAGKPAEGAYSIVLAGGYEDDTDDGHEFLYTGAGGRDLSGNKRTACQSHDQVLEKTNLAIAVSCAAKLDKKDGAVAKDWTKGKPIRVVRTEKLAKHSKYAPKEGCRYDGIYKVVKYWPQKGQAGFIVWRYLFRRDDPNPAPWTEEGKALIEENGYSCIYPEGYHEAQAAREKLAAEKAAKAKGKGKGKGKGKKRKKTEDGDEEESNTAETSKASIISFLKTEKPEDNSESEPKAKKPKKAYKIPNQISNLMDADELNQRLWQMVREAEMAIKLDFTNAVEENFLCSTCQELPDKPVTTSCKHNVCLSCLKRAFKSDYTVCPTCRHDLKEEPQDVNEHLQKALNEIFPGYNLGR